MADAAFKSKSEGQKTDERAAKNQVPWAMIGGVTMAAFTIIGSLMGGQVFSDSEPTKLVEVMSPALQMLGFATITATITMLSLILTMLGVVKDAEMGFDENFYKLIERISLIDTILLLISALLLTLLVIPITELSSDGLISFLYYLLIAVSGIIVGMLVTAVLMLFDVIKGVIRTQNIQEDNPPISA